MSSPTSRSLDLLRREGWVPGVVERHNTFSGKKNDYIGIIDIIAIQPARLNCEPQTLGVQACAGKGAAAKRVRKALDQWRLLVWLLAENRFEVWSWAKRNGGVPGKRKRWCADRTLVALDQPGVFTELLAALGRARVAGGSEQEQARAAFPDLEWERLSAGFSWEPAAPRGA